MQEPAFASKVSQFRAKVKHPKKRNKQESIIYRELPVEPNSIQVELAWHQRHPLLAVGAYSEEKGGYISDI